MADQTKRAAVRRTVHALARSATDEEKKKKGIGAAIYFGLGFVMSAARMMDGCAPFGAAMTAAAGPGIGGVSALAGACLGYVVTGGLDWGIRYIACCVLVYTASFVFQDLFTNLLYKF